MGPIRSVADPGMAIAPAQGPAKSNVFGVTDLASGLSSPLGHCSQALLCHPQEAAPNYAKLGPVHTKKALHCCWAMPPFISGLFNDPFAHSAPPTPPQPQSESSAKAEIVAVSRCLMQCLGQDRVH